MPDSAKKWKGSFMIGIELTEEMAEIWREVLVNYLSELRIEIAYTHRKEFREFLKIRGELLERSLLGLEKELAAGGREMISIDKLRTVDIFQGLTFLALMRDIYG